MTKMKLSSMLIHLHTMDVLRKAALEVDVGTVVLKAVSSITACFFVFYFNTNFKEIVADPGRQVVQYGL